MPSQCTPLAGDSDGFKEATSAGGKTSLHVVWNNPTPGIFYMIMWDGLFLTSDGAAKTKS